MEHAHDVPARVLDIVRSALLNSSVTSADNLFEAGGDSLTFMEICASIEDEFDVEVPLETAWNAPTIAELSSIVTRCLARSGGQPVPSP